MNRAPGMLTIILLAACSRTFTQPPMRGTLPDGTACADGGSPCGSGLCLDGVCCHSTCQAYQRCDEPGHAGLCTDRAPGEVCTDPSQCSAAFPCVDGVCCEDPEGRCDAGGCFACHVPGSEGFCTAVPDNLDLHRACAGQPCSACFAGSCAPALPDTDPDGSCAAMGRTCTVDQRCGVADGGSCSSNADCATGRCIAGACLHLDDEAVLTPSMNPFADARDVSGVANTPEGDLAIFFTESQILFGVNDAGDRLPVENEAYVAIRPAGADWSAVPLFSVSSLAPGAQLGVAPGRVVFLGRNPMVISTRDPANGTTCADAGQPCGAFAVSAAATGEVGAFEAIDRAALGVAFLDAVVDGSGAVDVVYGDSNGFHVRQRTGGGWHTLGDLPDLPDISPRQSPAIQAVGDDVYLVYATATNGLAAVFADGGSLSELDPSMLPCATPPGGFFDADTAKGPPRRDHLALTVMCDAEPTDDPGAVYRALFTPSAPQPWGLDPAPIGALGDAHLSSDGEWSAQSHLLAMNGVFTDYGVFGMSWLKPDGTWSREDALALVPEQRPNASYAISGDGAFPFAAYGINAYIVSFPPEDGGAPTVTGSELHAVYIHR